MDKKKQLIKDDRIELSIENCEQLLKPRHSHCLMYKKPYIYMIAGVEDGQPTRNCKRFHVYDKMWCDISIMPTHGTLNQPAVTEHESFMFVFDTYSEEQSIFKYNFNYDVWHFIPFKTTGFTIPRSIGPCAFR